MRPSLSEYHTLRGLRHHVRLWGPRDAPPLFLLHGWMDVSASFQFLVDAFSRDWRVIAPDWRGFGLSEGRGEPYWFPDYFADLDALLALYAPNQPVRLAGHSMGGNIAAMYAGIRPERVARLANLEGIGLAASSADEAPERYRRWLEQLASPPRASVYADFEALAARLRQDNPRLGLERSRFVARHMGEPAGEGVRVAADPWHKLVNPVLYRLEEAMACWRRVSAPVLWVGGDESSVLRRFAGHEADYRARLACFRDLREVLIEGSGHMLHHDQPEALARCLEEFMAPGC